MICECDEQAFYAESYIIIIGGAHSIIEISDTFPGQSVWDKWAKMLWKMKLSSIEMNEPPIKI